MKTVNTLTLLRRYQTLLELEEAGEITAVTALIKVWQYDHLFVSVNGSLTDRLRHHIAIFEEQLREEEEKQRWEALNTYRERNRLRWEDFRDSYWADPYSERSLAIIDEITGYLRRFHEDLFPLPLSSCWGAIRDFISKELGMER